MALKPAKRGISSFVSEETKRKDAEGLESGGCTLRCTSSKLGEVDVAEIRRGDSPYGNCTGPSFGVLTGVASPTISVRVFVEKFTTQRLPLASISMA
jgi:hypothetical protein